MEIRQAVFVKSSDDYRACPPETLPEYAFIGRSNVGKSSLINMLANQGGLAKTSSTPGKTQLINHFLINNAWYLADLPGFGYARTPKKIRMNFQRIITNYLLNRRNLLCIFLLIDARHEPQTIDQEFMEWLAVKELPFTILFTKADKLGKQALKSNIARYHEILLESWEELPPSIITSAQTGMGKEEILAFIDETNNLFVPGKSRSF
ncbi:MAG: ribosome biogenesis GTP-binding protein YihA/YsxC [Bacteroidales bacterium]